MSFESAESFSRTRDIEHTRMESFRINTIVFVTITMTSFVSARAVNISNTWMLPEEGFPVFYRYFRDRISWYEADAVCQFHHANLVTADSTSQYDAIRAYLKELDITENIWIGLSKSTESNNFAWTNYQPLSGEGHWQQPIPKGNEAICVSMDPATDFLWKPMPCGGPQVASFICELPVPSWAMGPKGCLLTELPSLTVLYIPEQLALELTSDCGLDGTRRIACKGNADREELLKHLTCGITSDDFDDKSTKPPPVSSSTFSGISTDDASANIRTTKPWTSNTVDIDYGLATRHRRETEDTLSPSSTKSTTDLSVSEAQNKKKSITLTNTGIETTSFNPREEETLDSSVFKSEASTTTLTVTDIVMQSTSTQTEEQGENMENVYTIDSQQMNDNGNHINDEYPSAIGQGQLFGIIENGTMFDIVEVNETTADDLKLSNMETPESEVAVSTASTERENLYTTVVYHKEPPSEMSVVTNKSVKKNEKPLKKHIPKNIKEQKKIYQQSSDKSFSIKTNVNKVDNNIDDKTLSKEVEMFPVINDKSVKLNRTHRKEVPVSEDSEMSNTSSNANQHVEIKWHQEANKNRTQMLFVTTKRIDSEPTKQTPEFLSSTELSEVQQKAELRIDLLNNSSTAEGNLDEVEVKSNEESSSLKKQLLPKSLIGDNQSKTDTTSSSPLINEPLESEPQAQPRPNRQRQLTRPQRRSFYPYFFSRVLG